jgi:putative spermidine/putrescine transport system ATP-binding protein
MRDEIRRIQRGSNIATLLITHDQDEALSLADRVVLLREGRLVQAGSPQQIYDAPADAFVAGFRRSRESARCHGDRRRDGRYGDRPDSSRSGTDMPPATRLRLLVRP